MDIEYTTLGELIGQSFTLLDGSMAVIYMGFDALPSPFFLIKRHGGSTMVQMNVYELMEVLHTSRKLSS